ncbi:MAG: hypothetical protein FJW30_07520 [Acidobacteria bacterium]|nr:hypothetical protein [Acidobacteriota bacterium]
MASRILSHFALCLTPGAAAAMERAARTHAKSAGLPFAPDSAAKRAEGSARLRPETVRKLLPIFEELEDLRAGTIR